MRSLTCLLFAPSLLLACSPAVPPGHAPSVSSFSDETYAGEAGTRDFKLYVPASYRADGSAPLVVMLHGCTQDPADFAAGSRMNALAEAHGALVVYPQQPVIANPQKCWNWYLPEHQAGGAGEPAIIAGITRDVMEKFRVDPRRVYVAGVSAGGAMALILAANHPKLYAAVGAHSAVPFRAASNIAQALDAMRSGGSADVTVGTPIPLIAFHGAADAVVNPANAERISAQWTRGARRTESRDTAGAYNYSRSVYRDPAGRILHERWVVDGLGHAWSGGAPAGTYTDPQGPDASREMMRFFLEHAREGR